LSMGSGGGLAAARPLEQKEQKHRCHPDPGKHLEGIGERQHRRLPLDQAG